MTASTLTQPSVVPLRFTPLMVLIIALAAFVAGLGAATVATGIPADTLPATQVVGEFDAPGFRLDEHNALAPVPAFDAPGFRLDEHNS